MEIFYPLLLRQSAVALQDVIATKTHGTRLGFTSVLHTWVRQIQHYSHLMRYRDQSYLGGTLPPNS